jgi:hypothetical protein
VTTTSYQNPRTRRPAGTDLRIVEYDLGAECWVAVYVGRKRKPLWRQKYPTTTDREDAVQWAIFRRKDELAGVV